MRTLPTLLVIIAVVLVAPAALRAQDGEQARRQELRQMIADIRSADTASAAAAAYARGSAIDSTSIPLQRAYLRRMLELGLPQIAYYPASMLTLLGDDNGLAWGVVGYRYAQRGRLGDALAATVRAAALEAGNQGILNNAGQLLAWYDNDPSLPDTDDTTKRLMDSLRGTAGDSEAFVSAYRRIEQAYDQTAELRRQHGERLAAARAAVANAQQEVDAIDRQIAAANDEIAYRRATIDALRRQLYYYDYYYRRRIDSDGDVTIYAYPRYAPRYRQELRGQILLEEQAIAAIELQISQLRRQRQASQRELRRRQSALDNLTRQPPPHVSRLRREFRWDPPAIDGQIIVERDRPPTPPPEPAEPLSREDEAARQVRLAELYLRHDMPGRAVEILRRTIREYEDTPAAQDAKALLARLAGME